MWGQSWSRKFEVNREMETSWEGTRRQGQEATGSQQGLQTKSSRGSYHLPEVRNRAGMGETGILEWWGRDQCLFGWCMGKDWGWKGEEWTHRLLLEPGWGKAYSCMREWVNVIYRDQTDHRFVGINIKCCILKSKINCWLYSCEPIDASCWE